MDHILVTSFIFILGTIWGSFLNVFVDRGQKGDSLLGHSHCDFCGHHLRWFENIPIISFLIIKGKCRKCRKKLSWQYPAVEAGTGIMFLLMASVSGIGYQISAGQVDWKDMVTLVFYLSVGFILVAIFLWDLKYMVIPDGLVVFGVVISLVFYFFRYTQSACSIFDYNCQFTSNLIGALVVSGFFYLLFVASKGKWIGGGDVKLGFWLGMLLGWRQVYFFLLFAYVLGAVVAVYLLAGRRKKMTSQVPFGPFLITSAVILIVYGQEINWIWKMLIW